MDELDEVAGPRRADELHGAFVVGEVDEQRRDERVGLAIAAGHEAGAVARAPDAAAGAHVEEADPPLGEFGMAALGVLPVRVAAVDGDVAGHEQRARVAARRPVGSPCGT